MDRFAHSFLLTHSRPGMDDCFLKTRRCLLKLTEIVGETTDTLEKRCNFIAFIYNRAISSILTLHGNDNDNHNLLK